MGLMDRIKSGLDRAKEETSDLAATTKIRVEMSGLKRRRGELIETLGERVVAMHAEGKAPTALADLCAQVGELDSQIAGMNAEIERINREPSA